MSNEHSPHSIHVTSRTGYSQSNASALRRDSDIDFDRIAFFLSVQVNDSLITSGREH